MIEIKDEFVQSLISDRRKLSLASIERLAEWASIHRLAPIRDNARRIRKSDSITDKRAHANTLLNFLKNGIRRQSYAGQAVDLSSWRLGTKGLMGGKIGICPVCGRKGEVFPPYGTHFKGDTLHKVETGFGGVASLDSCDWESMQTVTGTLYQPK